MSVPCHLAIDLEYPVLDEQGNITFENLSTNCQSKIKSNSSKDHTDSLSRMDIDYVPINANMAHAEWKSIESICILSMILSSPHCLGEWNCGGGWGDRCAPYVTQHCSGVQET